jgi:hypothetical protein
MVELNSHIKKRFCKDFRLPINIFDEPYFQYFVDLYDPLLSIKEKQGWLESVLNKCEVQDDFFQQAKSVSDGIKELIKNSKAYNDFNTRDMKDFPLKKNVSQQNIYIDPNVGKEMISIDLEKANFNAFRLFGLQEEIGCNSYKELVQKFSDEQYFIESKMIRQVIFGDLNPSRQQTIQKYIIQNLCDKLLENGCEISSASSDEIIIKNKNNIVEVKDMLKDVDDRFKFFRVEKFHFDRVGEDFDYFVKKTTTDKGEEKIEFKNTPAFIFAQVYKQHYGISLNEYDMLFYHEGYLAEFKEPVFKNTLKIKAKP